VAVRRRREGDAKGVLVLILVSKGGVLSSSSPEEVAQCQHALVCCPAAGLWFEK